MKKQSIGYRITLWMVVVALFTATLSLVLFYSLSRGAFKNYVKENKIQEVYQFAQVLGNIYDSSGWDGVKALVNQGGMHGKRMGGMSGHNMRSRMMQNRWIATTSKIIITDIYGDIMATSDELESSESLWDIRVPIYANNSLIGYLTMWMPLTPGEKSLEAAFTKNILQYSLYSFVFGLGIAIFVGVLVSSKLIRPIKDLSSAVRLFSQGRRDIKIESSYEDELGSLARDFNNMAQKVEIAERQRKNLTADIAHELRTPITILQGTLESIQAGVLEPTSDVLMSINDEVLRMGHLIKDLSDVSRAEAGNLDLDMKLISPHILENKFSYFEMKAKSKGIDFVIDIPMDLPHIFVDDMRIVQVISNLLNNALHHTISGEIKLFARKKEDGVVFCVEDTGGGIKEEELPFVFERFYREEKSRSRKTGGMGLGLTISKSIIEAHGGQIWVESTPDVGSKFFFWLPKDRIS